MGLKPVYSVWATRVFNGGQCSTSFLVTACPGERKARTAAQNASMPGQIARAWVVDFSGNVLVTFVKGIEQPSAQSGQGEATVTEENMHQYLGNSEGNVTLARAEQSATEQFRYHVTWVVRGEYGAQYNLPGKEARALFERTSDWLKRLKAETKKP